MTVQILRAGPQTTIQDQGRVDRRAIGLGASGALDPFAARVANVLVGNDESAALIEVALGNVRMRFEDERLIAWCGGEFDVSAADSALPPGHVCLIRADEELVVRSAKGGCRLWLAISGGIDVPIILGSRSTDLRAAFGGLDGRALRDGDELPLGQLSAVITERMKSLRQSRVSSWGAQRRWSATTDQNLRLRFVRGTDWSLFPESTHEAFKTGRFLVTREADRMGVRLDGLELRRNDATDLLSEAVAPGTIQIPPNGKPILLLGDCQTIGGYPKIAHVITVDLPIAAQLRPDDEVRFMETSLAEAHFFLREREREFMLFRTALSLRTS